LTRLRADQNLAAWRYEFQQGLIENFLAQPDRKARLEDLEREVAAGRLTPRLAARAALQI